MILPPPKAILSPSPSKTQTQPPKSTSLLEVCIQREEWKGDGDGWPMPTNIFSSIKTIMFLTKTKSRFLLVHLDSFFGRLCLAGPMDDKSPSSVQDKGIRGGVEDNNVSLLKCNWQARLFFFPICPPNTWLLSPSLILSSEDNWNTKEHKSKSAAIT